MKTMPLQLTDLVPKETKFKLSDYPDKDFSLCRWSLRVRAWATDRYTSQGLKTIFETQQINEIADLAYFMLIDKDFFTTKDNFLDAIITIQDQINIIKALLGAVGIGEPELEKLSASVEIDKKEAQSPNVPSPKSKKTGAKSLTP